MVLLLEQRLVGCFTTHSLGFLRDLGSQVEPIFADLADGGVLATLVVERVLSLVCVVLRVHDLDRLLVADVDRGLSWVLRLEGECLDHVSTGRENLAVEVGAHALVGLASPHLRLLADATVWLEILMLFDVALK